MRLAKKLQLCHIEKLVLKLLIKNERLCVALTSKHRYRCNGARRLISVAYKRFRMLHRARGFHGIKSSPRISNQIITHIAIAGCCYSRCIADVGLHTCKKNCIVGTTARAQLINEIDPLQFLLVGFIKHKLRGGLVSPRQTTHHSRSAELGSTPNIRGRGLSLTHACPCYNLWMIYAEC